VLLGKLQQCFTVREDSMSYNSTKPIELKLSPLHFYSTFMIETIPKRIANSVVITDIAHLINACRIIIIIIIIIISGSTLR